jgi:hypothetical protein
MAQFSTTISHDQRATAFHYHTRHVSYQKMELGFVSHTFFTSKRGFPELAPPLALEPEAEASFMSTSAMARVVECLWVCGGGGGGS